MDKQKRKPNWSTDELEALAQGVSANIKTIRGKFSPGLTNSQKTQCWQQIAERVNSVNISEITRDVVDCKKKWQDISSATKKKEAARLKEVRGTGGGPAPVEDIKTWERLILGTLSKCSVEGVEGGVDTLECNKATTSSFITIEKDYDSVSGICDDAVADLPDNLPDSISEMKEASVPTLPPTLPEACTSNLMNASWTRPVKKKKLHDSCSKSAEAPKDVREEFLEMERERDKHVHEYRAKKIKLYEKMVAQQDEILQLQRRSTEAVELIVAKFPGHSLNSPLSPFSVSPIIKFPNLS